MIKKLGILTLVLAAIAAGIFFVLTQPSPMAQSALPDYQGDADRGELMFWAGGCASCHAAPGSERDEDLLTLAGGLAMKTPFGTFRVPNISPHSEAGIGGWTDLEFVNAMVRGLSPDGQHYYPAFPYTSYQRMKLEDVIDLKTFLDTLVPVAAKAPEHEVGFPFNIRRGLGLWKWLYLDGKTFVPDPDASEMVNRGRYLAEGPIHCAECHTPRSVIGGLDRSRWLAGAPTPDGKGFVPNITPHKTGIGDWSEDDIAYSFETGFTPEFDTFGSSMTDVQRNMARLPESDRRAIARYLKTVPALTKSKK